jgi:hypothetical protein
VKKNRSQEKKQKEKIPKLRGKKPLFEKKDSNERGARMRKRVERAFISLTMPKSRKGNFILFNKTSIPIIHPQT